MQRVREESELRLEMRLGVPGDRVFARKEGPGEHRGAEQENPRGGPVDFDVIVEGARRRRRPARRLGADTKSAVSVNHSGVP